jgi:hypothetical protein
MLLGCKQKMDMTCLQRIRMNFTNCNLSILSKPFKGKQVIIIGKEAGLFIISSLNEMKGRFGHHCFRSSWHDVKYIDEMKNAIKM